MKMFKGLMSALVVLCAFNTQAAIINVTFDVLVIEGVGSGETGSVDFAYDDSLLTGSGEETLSSSEFTMDLDLFGQLFTEEDDVDFPGFPELFFDDGDILGIDLIIVESDFGNSTDINEPGIVEISGGFIEQGTLFLDTNEAADIPEPAGLALVLAGLLALRRRA